MMLIALAFLCVVLAWITWIDSQKLIIPDVANALLLAGGIIQGVFLQETSIPVVLMAPFVAGGLVLIFRSAYKSLRGINGVGLGDVKFLAAAAPWVGLWNMPLMILISCMSALAYVVFRDLQGRGIAGSEKLPFGPHLCLGLAITWGTHAYL